MAAVEVLLIVFGFAAIFTLLVVVPWVAIRVRVAILEFDAEATVDRWVSLVPKSERKQFDKRRTEEDHDEQRSRSVASEHGVRDR